MVTIGPIKHLLTHRRTLNQTEPSQNVQFTLQCSGAQALKFAGKLTVIEGLIWMLIEQAENSPPPFSK